MCAAVSWPIIPGVAEDWIEQRFTSLPTQYRLYGRWFLQVKRPNQQYQSTEGVAEHTGAAKGLRGDANEL